MHGTATAAEEYFLVIELPAAAEVFRTWTLAAHQLAVGIVPAAHPLPALRGAEARLGVHRAPPLVFLAGLARPEHLAGDRTRLAAHAFVQIEDHGPLPHRG